MKVPKEWKVMFNRLKYSPIMDDERILDIQLTKGIFRDEDIMRSVVGYHSKGLKCAVVVIYKNGETDGCVAGEDWLKNNLDFQSVHKSVQTYDTKESICMVFIRGRRITVSEIGFDGDFDIF